MKPRDIFIKACNEIAIPFIAMGFKPSKNGQCLKKISKDKNLTFEIWFRSSVYNSSCSVAIYPLITITCKNLKKWVQEENLNVNDDGLVYHNHIGYLSPINQYQSWDLAGLSYAPSIKTKMIYLKNMLVRYLIYLRIDKWLLTSLRNMAVVSINTRKTLSLPCHIC